MATKIKFSFLKILFNLFSKLSDATGGWYVFVKPKLWFGAMIIGITGVAFTSCNKPKPMCYDPVITCYEIEQQVDTTATDTTQEIPEVLCYLVGPPK